MDIFKFKNPTYPFKMEQGEIINDLKSKLWIERYRPAGEFKLIAEARSGIKEKLPIGSFISHTNTSEVMIVEDHEINDDRDKETEIAVTGRGLETYFSNRVVGSNVTFPVSTGVKDYPIAAGYSWVQARDLLQSHIYASILIDDDNAIYHTLVFHDVPGTGTSVARSIKEGDLYVRFLELLENDQLGVKIARPGSWYPASTTSLSVVIHKGVDRTDDVVFSYDSGEIKSADYLWSNRKIKTAAVISGKWVKTFYSIGGVGYNRRVMYVDASDIDNSLTAAPTGATLTNIVNYMQYRGWLALMAQKDVVLVKAEPDKETGNMKYRDDFNVGDLIMVSGDYSEATAMVVSEYVEIEDENGFTGYPTLSMP